MVRILTLLLSLSCCVFSSTYTEWSASISLSLPGSNGGIYTGTTYFSLTSGGWKILYDNSIVRVERFFVPIYQNIINNCGPCSAGTQVASFATNSSITYTFLADTKSKHPCAQKRFTFQIPNCAQSYKVVDCTGTDITKEIRNNFGCDPFCQHFDGLFVNLNYVPISSNCVGKSFTLYMYPQPGYTLVPSPGYIGIYGDSLDGTFCQSCTQTGFTCHTLYTPLSSYTQYDSCCNVDLPDYKIPVLWLDTSYYNISSKTLDATGCVHYTKQNSAVGVVTDIWVNNSKICRAYFDDGRQYVFSNVVPQSFTPADFPAPDTYNCTCGNPLDIALVLDRWSSFTRWNDQRNAALYLVEKFYLSSTNVQLSVFYADRYVYNVLPLIGGCFESNILRAITSIGCENEWFNNLYAPCALSSYGLVVPLGDRIMAAIEALNNTQSGIREFSQKVVVVMYDGYAGLGDDGDAGFWDFFNRFSLSNILDLKSINEALKLARSLNILTFFIATGSFTTLPEGMIGDYLIYNSSDYTTLTDNIMDLTAKLCATNTQPCGECDGLCACTQCVPPTKCVPSNECEILIPDSMGHCIRSDQLACNVTQKCARAICNDDGTCGEVSMCPQNTSCYSYTCTSTGTCESHFNSSSNPCLLSECVLVNGIPTITYPEKCPIMNDTCYSYGCNNQTGDCYKIPNNPPHLDLTSCQKQTCTNGSWEVVDIKCIDVPEMCLKGVCNNQTGQCNLVSTCVSSGCMNRTCVNGNCTESIMTCPDISDCLQAIACDPLKGVCDYKPCISTDPCREPACKNLPDSAFCANQSIPGLTLAHCTACQDVKLCPPTPDTCSYNLCDPSRGCRTFQSCSSVNCYNTNCTTNPGSSTPNCTYIPIDCTIAMGGPPSVGMKWVFQQVPLGDCCIEEPICPQSTGCVNITSVTEEGLTSCVATSLCTSTGCPTQSCQTSSGISICVNDTITCPGSDLCFDCPPDSCSLDPILCDTTNLCKISGQCSLTSGCFFPDKNCDDGNPCTVDSCNASTGNCSHKSCFDDNPCTIATCIPSQGCVYTNVSCNDNNACTRDYCDPSFSVPCRHIPINCDDMNPCTNDTCNTLYGCVYTPIICPKKPYGCSVSYCQADPQGNATCYTKSLTCVEDIMPEEAIAGVTLAVAALAGIIIGAVVFAAAGGGVAFYVSQYVASGSNAIITVNENAAYTAQSTKGGENPLQSELHDTVE